MVQSAIQDLLGISIGTIFTLLQVRRERMISDEIGRQLHNRSTLGEQLTNIEKEQLDAWYAKLDAIEGKLLGDNADSQIDLATLPTQIEASLNQLTFVTQRIQQISSENNALRQEIGVLRQQLVLESSHSKIHIGRRSGCTW